MGDGLQIIGTLVCVVCVRLFPCFRQLIQAHPCGAAAAALLLSCYCPWLSRPGTVEGFKWLGDAILSHHGMLQHQLYNSTMADHVRFSTYVTYWVLHNSTKGAACKVRPAWQLLWRKYGAQTIVLGTMVWANV
jgi:hypothetical protein